MSGLLDDEGKTPARGRKNKATEARVAELTDDEIRAEQEDQRQIIDALPPSSDEMAKMLEPGHPFEHSIKEPTEGRLADDYAPGLPGYEKTGSIPPYLPDYVKTGPIPPYPSDKEGFAVKSAEQVNRLPISLERRERIINLIWDRTRFRTGRVEWRDLRDLLKEVVEQL